MWELQLCSSAMQRCILVLESVPATDSQAFRSQHARLGKLFGY